MRADNDGLVAFSGERGDNAGLAPGVWEDVDVGTMGSGVGGVHYIFDAGV